MTAPVTYERKVRYSDTDVQGIVFNGNYFTYFDDTLTDFLDAAGLGGSALISNGYDLVLARAEIDFKGAARLGDVVVCTARVTKFGRTSITFSCEARHARSRKLLAQAVEVYVVVGHDDFRPVPVPPFVVDAIERLQGPTGG